MERACPLDVIGVLHSHGSPVLLVAHIFARGALKLEARMGGCKAWHDAFHDHEVERFASERGFTADLVWELILEHGNSRKAVMKAAQLLRGDDVNTDDQHPAPPLEPTPPLTKAGQ